MARYAPVTSALGLILMIFGLMMGFPLAVSFLMLTFVFLFRVRRARERARLGRDSAGF